MPTYKNDPELGFIELSLWEERNGREPRYTKGNAQIMTDIEPFKSPIDGSVINSRPQLNAHNEKHGVTNIADYESGHFEKRGKEMAKEARGQTPEAKKERKQLIDKTLRDYGV